MGDEKQLTFPEFMAVILDLRGSKTARVKDVVNLRKHINYRFQRLDDRLMDITCVLRDRMAELHGGTTPKGSQWSVGREDVRAGVTKSHGQSNLPGVTSVAKFQDTVIGSLRDLQASHERELAVLHAENIRLLDKL